jgi:hypothetical protein
MFGALGLDNLWRSCIINARFEIWFSRKGLEFFLVVTYMVLWGIWLARNASLF